MKPSTPGIAETPQPPYYAVIFTSQRSEEDQGYDAMAQRMMDLASKQPGFLGVESVRNDQGVGITVSYWSDEASIVRWKADTEHQAAQSAGRRMWYEAYEVRVAKVERAYRKEKS